MYLYFVLSFQQTFIAQYANQQGIKTSFQFKKDSEEVHKAFSSEKLSDDELFYHIPRYDVFKYKINDKLVCAVYLHRQKYHSLNFKFSRPYIKEEDAVEIYSLYVNKEYRGKGYSRILLYNALAKLKSHYNLKNDFILGLHLNPEDLHMNISFALYFSMGFDKGSFGKYGPGDYQHKFDMYNLFHNPLEIIKNPSICKQKGPYMVLFTRYNKFNPFRSIKSKKLLLYGENLRKILALRLKK